MKNLEHQSVGRRSAQGAAWLLGRRLLANVIRIAAMAVLARHLAPADFGLAALAQVLLAFIVLSGELGIGTYVIADRQNGWERRANSAFWLGLLMTACQLVLFAGGSVLVTSFYPQPVLLPLLSVLAGAFLFRQLAVIPEALLRRRLDYQRLVIRDALSDIAGAGLSLALAVTGFGVWSLVLPQLLIEPLRTASIFFIARWRPSWSRDRSEWPQIARYTLHMAGNNVLLLLGNDGDTLLIGKVLGAQALGFYNLAYQLANIVGRNVTGVVSGVATSAFATMVAEPERLRAGYARLVRLLAFVGFPLLFGLFVLAPEAIAVVYGPGWEPSIALLRLLIVFTSVRIVTSQCGIIFNVVGRPDIGWKYNACFLPFYLAAIFLGSRWGVLGVAAAVMAVRVVGGIIPFAISTRLIGLPFGRAVRPVLAAARVAAIMAVAVAAAQRLLLPLHIGTAGHLVIGTAVGALVYLVGLYILEREALRDVVVTFASALPGPVSRRLRAALGSIATYA